MKFEQIEELMSAMNRLDFEEVIWREKESQIQLKRKSADIAREHAREKSDLQESPKMISTDQARQSSDPTEHWIVSPMVGTFYLTPSPNTPCYVKVGDSVCEQSVVCIIEAMKVMNEVRAPLEGVVSEIAVQGGSAVEFGTKLMRISTTQKS